MENLKVAAIIPAYNEETTIRKIIHSLQKCDLVSEIIVVNDCSTDRTAEIVAEEYGVTLVSLAKNVGKGGAVKEGLGKTNADIILLLDADLIGLQVEHIYGLLEPVISGEYQSSVGIFKKGRTTTDFAQKIVPKLSGQRAIRRHIIENIDVEKARFGLEVAIAKYLDENNIKSKEVELYNLTHVMKEEKLGYVKGFKARMVMYWEILKIIFGF